jgi:hypothetical protein
MNSQLGGGFDWGPTVMMLTGIIKEKHLLKI